MSESYTNQGLFGYHASMIFRLILLIFALNPCYGEMVGGFFEPKSSLWAVLKTSPDTKTIHLINQWVASGISVRIISDTSRINTEEQLWDLLDESVQIRFLDSPDVISHDIFVVDEVLAIWAPTLFYNQSYRLFYPRFEKDPESVSVLQAQVLDVWKSLSSTASQIILKGLKHRSEDTTIVTPSVSVPISVSTSSVDSPGFVASKNSKVYHPANSGEAQRILEENKVFFATEADALASGRRRARK